MSRSVAYACILAFVLSLVFIAGNPSLVEGDGATISTFPYLLALIPIPLLIGRLILGVARRAGGEFSVMQGTRVGERASRWAAIAFSVVVCVYAIGYFSATQPGYLGAVVLWGGATAFFGTYVVGLFSALAISVLLEKNRDAGAS